MPSIKPSVFIGLGTTGAEILGYLQELMVQEYLAEEFPVTRLLSFVTEESDGRMLRHAGKERVVYLTVPSTEVVRSEMLQGTTRSSRALNDWLANELCMNSTRFTNGSNAMRAAGRLHLWRNYETVRESIAKTIRDCTTLDQRRAAADHLSARMNIEFKRVEEVVESGVNIYVVGSLCGGTCSGMFLDLGHVLRFLPEVDVLRGGNAVQVFGVFSTLNNAQARSPEWELQAANCYAALREFDYFYHSTGATFPVVLPDGEERPRDHLPYDYVYLLSPTSMAGESLVDTDGDFSHQAVLRMIAHSLFLDSYAGTYSIKQGMRTDWHAKVVLGDPDPEKRNPRAIFSFGCALITYPMYSIARAAAARVARDVCAEWLTGVGADFGAIVQEAREKLLSMVLPFLTQGRGMPPLAEQLRNEITASPSFLGLDALTLRRRILELPDPRDPVAKRFQTGGRYPDILENRFNELVKPMTVDLVRSFVEQCRVERGLRLPDALECLARFRKVLQDELSRIGKVEATEVFATSRLEPLFNRLDMLERDFWLRGLGLRDAALAERKAQVRTTFADLAVRALQIVTATFRRRAIEVALRELERIEHELRKEEQVLRELADPSNNRAGYFASEAVRIEESLRSPSLNVRYVWSAPNGAQDSGRTCESELRLQQQELTKEDPTPTMVNSVIPTGGRFTRAWTSKVVECSSADELGAQILGSLTIELLKRMKNAGIQVLDETLRSWTSLADVVNYASPYLEFTQKYLQGSGNRLVPPTQTTTDSVFGGATNDEALARRLRDRVPDLRHQNGRWGYHALTGLPHYLIFYQEEAYFSSTFMAAAEGYEKAYQRHLEMVRGGGTVLRWTDKHWHPHGPPIGDADRAEYIGFLLEHALQLLRGSGTDDDDGSRDGARQRPDQAPAPVVPPPIGGQPADLSDRLFGSLQEASRCLYYFELQEDRAKIPERVYLYNRHDYLDKAKRDTACKFIPRLVERLAGVVRSLGSGADASLDELKGRVMFLRRQLDVERDRAGGNYKGEFAKRHQDRYARLEAFFLHVRELTWSDRGADDQERERLRQFPWLINWAAEKY